MIHDRPYKRAISHEAAIAELRRHAGTQFDPELSDAFVKLIEVWRTQMRERGHDSLIPR
jgi:HD-GYP domain-containing protein (c-di-GMP phosphodiesterase class II)